MKAIAIPLSLQGHLDSIEEAFVDYDTFCWHKDVHIRDYYFGSLRLMKVCLGIEDRLREARLGELEEIYDIPIDVSSFLAKHTSLVNLLKEGVPKLEEHFGAGVKVQLELFRDPDKGDDCEVFGRILTNRTPQEALETLDRFDEEWWLDASARAGCLLNFALRYV